MDSLESITIHGNNINSLVDETAPESITPKRRYSTRDWPLERIEELKMLFYKVPIVSYAIIGKELGISRCAVAGKVKRLGLAERCPTRYAKRQPAVSKEARTSAGHTRRKPASARRIEFTPRPLGDEPTDIVVEFIPLNPVTFAQLGEDHCRFPVSDSPVMFCGERPKEDRPYCTAHCRICYKPSSGPKPWVPGRVET